LLLTAGIIAWLVWPRYLIWSATNALNSIYTRYRPFPYRWVGAGFSVIKVQESTPGCTAIPENKLAESRLKIAQAELRAGQTAQSLQQLGRVDLLLCRPSEAIQKYKLALLSDPDNPSLNLELGVAFALDASMDSQLERQGALDYEAALEAMLRSARHSQSPEILFDSALLFEEAQLPIQAQERWTQAEKLDHATEWRAEDQARLAALQRRIKERQQRMLDLTTSPDSFLAHGNDGSGNELALSAAIEHWIPEMRDSAAFTPALARLGSMLLSDHNDRWFLDVMKMKPSGTAIDAFKNLALAVSSNIKGEHIRAADFAHKAESYFLTSHNAAGALRARFEIVYSLDRRSQPGACLAELEGTSLAAKDLGYTERVISAAKRLGYTWIEAQSWLEDITCRTRTRQEDVIKSRKEAYEWIAAKTGYEGLRLRALGFMTEEYVSADSRLTLWRRGEQGLRAFWSKPLPALRGYSLYFTLAESALRAGNQQTAVALLRESSSMMKEPGFNAIRALLLSYLGVNELEAGLDQAADATFGEAAEEYNNLDPAESTAFRQQSEAIHAEALISTGRPTEGLARLDQLTKRLHWPFLEFVPNIRRPLLPALGDAYLALNDSIGACNNYRQSITENSDNLTSLQDSAQRDNALHEIEPAWRGMTAITLKLGHPSEALLVWEKFRSSRKSKAVMASLGVPECSVSMSSAPFPPIGNVTILVYAFLPGGLSGWIVNGAEVEQRWIDARRTRTAATHFAELVASRESPLEEVSKSGQELYGLLLKPFADKLPENGTVVIDAEGVLASVPWSALEDRPGHPLVERFAFLQEVGLAEVLQPESNQRLDVSKVLIFGSPTLRGELSYEFPNLPDAAREAERLHNRFPHSVLLPSKEATADAFRKHAQESTLFHFGGHGVSYGGFGALLLAPAPEDDFSTQYMTANEIAGLDLRRMKLVVLAACSSGVGEQSGVVNLDGLTRAFLEAGAGRIVAANWEVDSGATTDLMATFYDKLSAGAKPAEALRQAQLRVRLTSARPYYWAGFQVFGIP
jgi:CHAT domain-containing protein